MSDIEKAKQRLAELEAQGNARVPAQNGSFCKSCNEVCTVESHIQKAALRGLKKQLGTDDPAVALRKIGEAVEQPRTKAAQQLRDARISKGLTQQELADRIGVTQPSIATIEKSAIASGLLLTAVCNALNVDIRELGR